MLIPSSMVLAAPPDLFWFCGMALFGGLVGHIESVRPGLRTKNCILQLFVSWVRALFLGVLFYLLYRACVIWTDSEPSWFTNIVIWLFMTGLACVFSRETIRTMYVTGKNKISQKIGSL
jgi:hypothetical protein